MESFKATKVKLSDYDILQTLGTGKPTLAASGLNQR